MTMEMSHCKHLRTKRLFIPDLATHAFADAADPAEVQQCWCNKTMRPIGLDELHVNPKACSDPKRTCYEGL